MASVLLPSLMGILLVCEVACDYSFLIRLHLFILMTIIIQVIWYQASPFNVKQAIVNDICFSFYLVIANLTGDL